MVILINIVIASTSSLMVCFVDDVTMIVNHKLCLYSCMFFLFA